jgi:hypothetical protein
LNADYWSENSVDDQFLEHRLQRIESDVGEYTRDQRLILSELKRFSSWLNELDGRFDLLDIRLAKQEVKAGLWGAIGGAAAVIVAIFLRLLWIGGVRF